MPDLAECDICGMYVAPKTKNGVIKVGCCCEVLTLGREVPDAWT